jgi:hypothetical protein
MKSNIAFNTYIIYRCNRWGTYERWYEGSGIRESKPKRVRSWWGPVVLDGNVKQDWRDPRDICPVDIAEALETRASVYGLPYLLRDVLIQEHVKVSTQEQKAVALKFSRTTFWRYRELAYARLLGRLNDAAIGLLADESEDTV